MVLIAVILLFSCNSLRRDPSSQIRLTTDRVVETFSHGTPIEFRKFIGVELRQIGKNDEIIENDFRNIREAIVKGGHLVQSKTSFNDDVNELGSRVVKLDFLDSALDTLVEVELYFGPPNFVPLNRIANYKYRLMLKEKSDRFVAPSLF